ncbi:MAG TPA: hypothetical protein K8V93_04705 [Corynebacterium pollutisoli]|nr:hypothetical protein [Corynebacterium pollutisoli]
MNRWLLIAVAAAVAFGVVLLYLGELDDSPGLGGIGLILMVGAVILAVRQALKGRR